MTKAQRKKSVAIAKDVLKNIKFLMIKQGSYLQVAPGLLAVGEELQAQLKTVVFKKNRPCRVCALGACLLSHVNLFDKFKVPELSSTLDGKFVLDDTYFEDDLLKSMGAKNLLLIEDAFELRQVQERRGSLEVDRYPLTMIDDTTPTKNQKLRLAAVSFGRKYKPHEKRLAAIMRNVIRNDGEFCPQ